MNQSDGAGSDGCFCDFSAISHKPRYSYSRIRGCLATWCWRGFGGVVDSSLELTASGFGYLENQSFEQTPHNVTAPRIRNVFVV